MPSFQPWRWIYSTSWPKLIAIQQSFASKAILMLSAVAFAIGTLAPSLVEGHITNKWRVHCLFWGAVLFLVGQALLWLRRPIEFVRSAQTEDAIRDILPLSNERTFESRCVMLQRLVARYRNNLPSGLDPIQVEIASNRADQSLQDLTKWQANLPLIVTSQRHLISFDRPHSRMAVVLFLGVGVFLMLLPMGINVVVTAGKLIAIYWRWVANAICAA